MKVTETLALSLPEHKVLLASATQIELGDLGRLECSCLMGLPLHMRYSLPNLVALWNKVREAELNDGTDEACM